MAGSPEKRADTEALAVWLPLILTQTEKVTAAITESSVVNNNMTARFDAVEDAVTELRAVVERMQASVNRCGDWQAAIRDAEAAAAAERTEEARTVAEAHTAEVEAEEATKVARSAIRWKGLATVLAVLVPLLTAVAGWAGYGAQVTEQPAGAAEESPRELEISDGQPS